VGIAGGEDLAKGLAPEKAAICAFMSSTMPRKLAAAPRVSSGNRSARLTTPIGTDSQAFTDRASALRPGAKSGPKAERSIQESSVEPPPTSIHQRRQGGVASRSRHPATEEPRLFPGLHDGQSQPRPR